MSAELPSDETAKDEGAPHEEFATDAGFIDEEGAQDPILADASEARTRTRAAWSLVPNQVFTLLFANILFFVGVLAPWARSIDSISLAQQNVKRLGLQTVDYRVGRLESHIAAESYGWVDIDPFGTPAPFIDAAVLGALAKAKPVSHGAQPRHRQPDRDAATSQDRASCRLTTSDDVRLLADACSVNGECAWIARSFCG